ncbi:hypothetical protein NC653_034895 [Populus alba x Populus x berolinensis]|uniref:Uncharacterized protein n=1 Tax=Populus alba x Populus x berolinensis TaxID=444605 RepID=A0AAD6LNR1_9ROSI|nr:hypothetical protein NC653_034895 [Populus alba x Populus x berolinensis]
MYQPVPRRKLVRSYLKLERLASLADAQDFGNHYIRTLKLLFTRHRGADILESLVLK